MNSVPTTFWEWFAALNREELIGVMFFGLLALLVTTIIICVTIYSIHQNRLDGALKRELLDRGMSPEEIATVISAKPRKSGGCGRSGSSA